MTAIDNNNNLVITEGFAYDILGLVPGSIITVSIVSSNSSIPEAYIYDTDTVLSGVGDSTTFEVADTSIRVTANVGEGTVVVLSITYAGEETPSLYSYPSIVPAAVSSELDESGEERIHIAPYAESGEITPGPTPPGECVEITLTNGYLGGISDIANPPADFEWGVTNDFGLVIPDGPTYLYSYNSGSDRYEPNGEAPTCMEAFEGDFQVGEGSTTCMTGFNGCF